LERPSAFSDAEPGHNIVLWIGGLCDGLLTVPYPINIAAALPGTWTLAQVLLTSSYTGWGTSSLAKDATELGQAVKYFRTVKTGKVVLMGHSTGCQDIMEYLVGKNSESRPKIDGGILQGAVSDREGMQSLMPDGVYEAICKEAKAMVASGRGEDIVPTSATQGFYRDPCCARRWLSLMSPDKNGDDDYFSSDLTDEQLKKTFGALPAGTPICLLFSGNDQFMPDSVDKKALLKRWSTIVKGGNGSVDARYSGVVVGATHNLENNPEKVVKDLVTRTCGFLKVVGGK
jgi:hypothetical protein